MRSILNGVSLANGFLLLNEDIQLSLQKVVSALGEATQVDRCYIFTNKFEANELKLYYTQEWCNKGVESHFGNPDLSGISYDSLPGLYNDFIAKKPIYGLVKKSSNLLFKEIMESQDIKSYLFTPIFMQDIFWGWIGYDNCKYEQIWQKEDVDALFTIAKNIGIKLVSNKNESKLIKAKERFELTTLASQQGIWEWNLIEDKLYFSKNYMKMLGYSQYDFEHSFDNFKKRIHKQDISRLLKSLNDYLNKIVDIFIVDFRIKHKNGKYIWIRGSGIAQWDESNKAIYIVGSHLDITEIKSQQRQLEIQRDEYNYLINNLAEVVFRLNNKYQFTFLNNYWEVLSGSKKEDSLFNFFSNYIGEEHIKVLNKQFDLLKSKTQNIVSFNIQLKLKSGDYIWVQIMAKLLKKSANEDKSIIAGSILDINDRVLSEIRQKDLIEMKEEFVSMASHQFRTPLTVIYANAELLELYTANLPPPLVNKLDTILFRIKGEVDRMKKLMNNILVFGKYNLNEVKLNLEETNLSAFIINLLETYFYNLSDNRKISFNENKVNKKIFLDQLLFSHVITNIISNSIKYSEGKNNPIICINYESDFFQITVEDYGIGVPEDEIDKLFSSFYRASNTQTIAGSGLGLVVAKQFTELHGGSIKINSTLNIGTTITLIFPYNDHV